MFGWLGTLVKDIKDAKDAYDFAHKGIGYFVPARTHIAITGMAGAGKTVLFDYLSGAAYKPGYKPPEQSQHLERGKMADGGKKIVFSTIPGQSVGATERVDAIEEVFGGGRKIDLLMHVVANGFAVTRNQASIEVLIRDEGITTIKKYRDNSVQDELEDLAETCQAVRTSQKKNHTPTRMLIVIDKVDLYERQIAAARSYYASDRDSPFVKALTELRAQVGTDNFEWDVMPVCAHLESFRWNNKEVPSTITAEDRDKLIAALLRRTQSYYK